MSLQTRLSALITAIGADIKELKASQWTVVVKSADESVTSNITVQDDDELFFTAVSGAVYEVEMVLIYGSPVGAAAPDLKLGFGEDNTIRGSLMFAGIGAADAASQVVRLSQLSATALGFGTAAADRTVSGFGSHIGNGGTFKVQWAQNTSNVNAMTVRAGSVLRYRRIK